MPVEHPDYSGSLWILAGSLGFGLVAIAVSNYNTAGMDPPPALLVSYFVFGILTAAGMLDIGIQAVQNWFANRREE